MFLNKKKYYYPLFVFLCGLFLPLSFCHSSILYFEPAINSLSLEEVFVVDVMIDSQGQKINALEVEVFFDNEKLSVIDFSKAGSILNLWAQEPLIGEQSGRIIFVGGMSGGFLGKAILGKIVFQAIKEGSGEITFQEKTNVFLHQQSAEKDNLVKEKMSFSIFPSKEQAVNAWQEILQKDKTPPQELAAFIGQDPYLFNGAYFLVFSAQDKETGIDYYQVQEGKSDWQKATSPYLLNDQEMKSIIKVKAIDKSGNEKIIEIKPLQKDNFAFWFFLIFVLLILFHFSYKRHTIIKIIISKLKR